MKRVLSLIATAAFFVVAGNAGAMPQYEAPCFASGCGGVSEDGKRAVFTFDEPLAYDWAPEDQVYQRYQGQTTGLVNFPEGAKRSVKLMGVSEDARRIVVQTRSPLAPEDTDGFGDDLFAIEDGVATLLSNDPADPATNSSKKFLQFDRMSADGHSVYMLQFDGSGGGYCLNEFIRTDTQFKELPYNCDNWQTVGLSRDGSSVFNLSWESVIHRYRDGVYEPATTFPTSTVQPGNCTPNSDFGDVSDDGSVLLFSTNTPISPDDHNGQYDIYIQEADGSYTFIDTQVPPPAPASSCGTDFYYNEPVGLSSDGTKALISTKSDLAAGDGDHSPDLYRYEAGKPLELVTTGPADDHSEVGNPALGDAVAGWPVMWMRADASDDLGVVAWDTAQPLVAADTDSSNDVYARIDGETQLVSTGPSSNGEEINAKMLGVSNDGSRVAFTTTESLVALDTDTKMDVYGRSLGIVDRVGGDEQPARASASAKKRRSRTFLISAESNAPKMKVGKASMKKSRAATVRLTCPKNEETGPCRGIVSLKPKSKAGASGKGSFSIKAGRSKAVRVKLGSAVEAGRAWPATVRLKASDRLGNTARSVRRISVRR